jgi:hypothetical protein
VVVAPAASCEQSFSGATACALVAGLHYRADSGDTRFDGALRCRAHGLSALHVHGLGVRESPAHLTESHYVNGQAWLALILYNAAFPRDDVAENTLSQLERYILDSYERSRMRGGHARHALIGPAGDSVP